MTTDAQTPPGNDPEIESSIRFRLDCGSTTDAAPPASQVDPIRIPRAFERLGALVRLTERSRAYLVTLPLSGISQVAHEIDVAIDGGVPVKSVTLDAELDREEDWDELVAKLNVDQPADAALRTWEQIENRLYAARLRLSPEDRAKMEEGFALYVVWEPNLGT